MYCPGGAGNGDVELGLGRIRESEQFVMHKLKLSILEGKQSKNTFMMMVGLLISWFIQEQNTQSFSLSLGHPKKSLYNIAKQKLTVMSDV